MRQLEGEIYEIAFDPANVRVVGRPFQRIDLLDPVQLARRFEGAAMKHVGGRWAAELQAINADRSTFIARLKTPGHPNNGDWARMSSFPYLEALQRWVESRLAAIEALEAGRPATIAPLSAADLVGSAGTVSARAEAQSDRSVLDEFCEARPGQQAVLNAAEQAELLIWGPPGTGKTTTLGWVIAHHLARGRRVVGVAASNIAVDQLALAADNACQRLGICRLPGELLRIGFVKDEELRQRQMMVWNDALEVIRREIADTEDKLREIDWTAGREDRELRPGEFRRKGMLADTLSELERTRQSIIDQMIRDARAVFCTAHRYVADRSVFERRDTVLVVDEASMMGLPFVYRLLSDERRHALFAGDFRQLSPVSESKDRNAERWFQTSIFEELGAEEKLARTQMLDRQHMILLPEQSRMPPEVGDLISAAFYDGLLTTVGSFDLLPEGRLPSSRLVQAMPDELFSRPVIGASSGPLQVNGSHVWPLSARVAVAIAELLLAERSGTVGLITPFREQAKLLTRLAGALDPERIRVGTIHRLQGSEVDSVVFDPVQPCGWFLTQSRDALRLINVAVSRARSQVFFVAGRGAVENPFLRSFLLDAQVWRL
ncbi:MAG: AAA domain-containing protein [Fimbriimonadaceae bacterium]